MNGALTIGTLDGANVEICEELKGRDIFIFGNTVEQVDALRENGYSPQTYINKCPELAKVLDQIYSGFFSKDDPTLFHDLHASIVDGDFYQLCADFEDYLRAQGEVEAAYLASYYAIQEYFE
ncbi:unnamed protein product [Protopolystoma xenopodis]|uniref:Alpha-1,4 glucan phosphorylase n=1 Tax=Protopolystoma xenopodis TaxID=117903 RepID=A0A3S5AY01_9PLAT|nr:unnamed protein product [Protopolystoma xenopodis]